MTWRVGFALFLLLVVTPRSIIAVLLLWGLVLALVLAPERPKP